MTKTARPLSLKLKLILAYIYVGTIGSILAVLVYFFEQPQITDSSATGETTSNLAIALAYTVATILSIWVIYSFHKRKATTNIAFLVTVIVGYGMSSVINVPGITQLETMITLLLVAVDTAIAVFLFQSKEATAQLKNK